MSRENVDALRRNYAAFNRGDLDATMELFAPSAELSVILGESYRGREAIRRFFENLREVVEDYRIEPEEFIDIGDEILVPLRVSGRFRYTGLSDEIPGEMAHVLTFREGRIVRCRAYRDRGTALEAVGLSE